VRPRAIAVTPDGKTAYVVNQSRPQPPPWRSYEAGKRGRPELPPDERGTVTPIVTATNTPGEPIDVGNEPFAIAVTPDGKTVYVANTWENTGRLASGQSTVTPIATATNTPGPPIQVGSGPWAFAITPDGKTAYVINFYSHSVTPIATATNTPGPPIQVGQGPRAIAITPDGKTAYVASWQGGTVTPIATATSTAGAPIEVGEGAQAIVITPDGQTAYVGVWGNRARWCRSRPRPTRPDSRSGSATGHMRSRSRPEPAISDLSAMRCGPACAGRAAQRQSPALTPGQRRRAAAPP
jgi:YVTN family beta-propeller protein